VANVVKHFFGIIGTTIGITSVKVLGKYAKSCVNYAKKKFFVDIISTSSVFVMNSFVVTNDGDK
jgi:hypothetical protein